MRTTLMVLVLAAICASCRVDIDIDVAMQDDGSGEVTVMVIADAEVVQKSPTLGTDLRFDDVRAAGWTVDGPAATPSGGIQVELRHPFTSPDQATQILAEISGPRGPLVGITLGRTIVKRTTTYTLNGSLRVADGLGSFSDAELTEAVGATPYATQVSGAGMEPSDAVGITFSAVLPGSINNTTAATTGDVLSWAVPLDGTSIDVATLSETTDTRNSWASPLARGARIGLIAWGAVAVCIIVYVMWSRRRQRIENQPWY
ncbi:MAG: hypothetical protein ABIW84_05525 [Ilumatobacteraceae bacterium]